MGGSNGAEWSAVFVGARPGLAVPADLGERLVDLVKRAAHAWPELAFDPARVVAQLARVAGDDVGTDLVQVNVEDLALAVACADRVPGAFPTLERVCGPAIASAVARVDRGGDLHDEVRQVLFDRLFVGTSGQEPRIFSYAGRGPLAGWLAVAAQRVALDLRRDATRVAASDPRPDQLLPPEHHPEAEYLRFRYREAFEDAVSEALRELPDRKRLLLRLTTVNGLSHDQIANIYRVNQSTVSRWIGQARDAVLDATERIMCGRLGVPHSEFRSLAGLLLSRVDLSISRVLASEPATEP